MLDAHQWFILPIHEINGGDIPRAGFATTEGISQLVRSTRPIEHTESHWV